MNVVITGKKGLLGSSLMSFLKEKKYNVVGVGRDDVCLDDLALTRRFFERIKPSIIIHTAALTNVEYCESNPDLTYKDNVITTQNIVNYCVESGVFLVYISSTGIYGDKKDTPYNEFDDVNPTTVHHLSKKHAEEIIIQHLSKFSILRTGWLFSSDASLNKNFIVNRLKEAKTSEEMYSDTEQIGNPTYVEDLVVQMEYIISNNVYGVYNCVNEGTASRFDYVYEILRGYGLEKKLKGISHESFQRNAKVSLNESAENFKLELLGINKMRSWRFALEDAISMIKNQGYE